jgi:hypothetical protein
LWLKGLYGRALSFVSNEGNDFNRFTSVEWSASADNAQLPSM